MVPAAAMVPAEATVAAEATAMEVAMEVVVFPLAGGMPEMGIRTEEDMVLTVGTEGEGLLGLAGLDVRD